MGHRLFCKLHMLNEFSLIRSKVEIALCHSTDISLYFSVEFSELQVSKALKSMRDNNVTVIGLGDTYYWTQIEEVNHTYHEELLEILPACNVIQD